MNAKLRLGNKKTRDTRKYGSATKMGSKVIFLTPLQKTRTAIQQNSIKYHSPHPLMPKPIFVEMIWKRQKTSRDLAHYYFWLDILQSMFDKSIRINHKASGFHACASTSSHM